MTKGQPVQSLPMTLGIARPVAPPRVVVYTVITAGYDALPSFDPEPDVSYCLFTDDVSIPAQDFWQKSALQNPDNLTAKRLSRLPKLLPHRHLPPHDISIYMDANTRLLRPIAKVAADWVRTAPLAIYRHPFRGSLREEADECVKEKLDDAGVINAQMERYRAAGFQDRAGLTENRLIVRRNTAQVHNFNEVWLREYAAGSHRDQLSFMFSVWSTKLPLFFIKHSVRNSPYFLVEPHPHVLKMRGLAR